ncbi:acetylcholine receptor subunit alpha-type acr-16-like, partial [Tropilaelaps mercedesae]
MVVDAIIKPAPRTAPSRRLWVDANRRELSSADQQGVAPAEWKPSQLFLGLFLWELQLGDKVKQKTITRAREKAGEKQAVVWGFRSAVGQAREMSSMMFHRIMATALLVSLGYLPKAIGSSHERQLLVDLLKYYNTIERPTENHNQPVVVEVDIDLQKIIKMDPNVGEMTSNVWLRMSWKDVNLDWEPHQYDNLSTIRLPSSEIWHPDIHFYNGVSEQIASTLAVVTSRGKVDLLSPATVTTRCSAAGNAGRWFPFDEYDCSLVVGSWALDGGTVNLRWPDGATGSSSEVRVGDDSGDWQILDTSKARTETRFACCSKPYTSMFISVRLRRRALRHLCSLHLPLLWVLGLASSTFLVPTDRTDLRLISGILFVASACWWPSGPDLPNNIISLGHLFVGLIVLGVSICFVSHCLQLVLLTPPSSGRRQSVLAEYLNRLLTTPLALKLACISDNRPEHDK